MRVFSRNACYSMGFRPAVLKGLGGEGMGEQGERKLKEV
jgi:hypothetical protein